MKIIDKIKSLSYEEALIYSTAVTMCGGALFALGKIVMGIIFDPILIAAGAFSVMLAVARLTCILGAKKNKEFRKRNTFTAVFLFLGGLLYALYMSFSLYLEVTEKEYSMNMALGTAMLAFGELGFAIYGLAKTKEKAHDYRNIQIINLASALISMMTAQIALLVFTKAEGVSVYNSYSGIFVGAVTMLMAIYVYFAPQLSTIDREHNAFKLTDKSLNRLVDMTVANAEILLCKSVIYGSYSYKFSVSGAELDGRIERTEGFWSKLPLLIKILFIILSEILVFVWLIGYVFYFVRSVDMPGKLKRTMGKNGFVLVSCGE